jgi:tetratricopeptide (TPR) repeat protein
VADPTQSHPSPDGPTADPPAAGLTRDGSVPTVAHDGIVRASDAGSVSPVVTDRYKFLDELARGGMGVVYLATDTVLGREVAVKVLQEKYGPETGAARRFADEARIAAQLQHPAIPPIHDLGRLPDGRPFLAMKRIKGDTLDTLLAARPDPAFDRGRFVAVFEQVCQAIAFAHAHKVIHRDLKPANVMVGNFGDVQVMDWGLAKVLGPRDGESADDPDETWGATEIRSLRDSDGPFTQAGSVLGTPAFMPPEQAAGAVGKVDARSDVFGLGAILAVILTGEPPFAAGSAETTRVRAAQGLVEDCFGRLDVCGAEPELVALAKRCLAPKQENRPSDAGEVARAVAEFRAAAEERAGQAEVDRVRAEGERAKAEAESREQRKRRKVQLALAAAVVVLLLGGGAVAWWQQQQSAERDTERRLNDLANRHAAESALDLAEAAMRKENPVYGEIDAALDQADRRIMDGGTEPLHVRRDAAKSDRRMIERLDKLADRRWAAAGGKAVLDAAGAREGYRAAFQDYGLDFAADTVAELTAKVVRSHIAGPIRTGLVEWLGVCVNGRSKDTAAVDSKLIELLARLDPDPERIAILRAAAAKDRATLLARTASLDGRTLSPSFAALVGENSLLPPDRRLKILRQAQSAHPNHFGLAMSVSYAMPENNAIDEATYLRIAVALRPGKSVAYTNLGLALKNLGDYESAIAAYNHAIRIDPKSVVSLNNLGAVLLDIGELDGALAACKEAVRLDPQYAMAHNNLGAVLRTQDDLSGAVAEFREAVRLDPKYASAYNNLGAVLWATGDFDGSIAAYRNAIRIDPKHSNAVRNLPRVERMRELAPLLADILAGKAEPKTPAETCEFADLCTRRFQGRFAAAVRLYEKAFVADPKLTDTLNYPTRTHRYDAACAAVRAAWGDGVDAPADPGERAALRAKALAWLRADLAVWKTRAKSANTAERTSAANKLAYWLRDTDLSNLRSGSERGNMPAAERSEWDKFWTEVRSTREEALKTNPSHGASPLSPAKS